MKKFFHKLIVMIMTLMLSVPVFAEEEETTAEPSTIRILFTHDLHDHIDSYAVTNTDTGEREMIGGYAALAGLINTYRNEQTVLVDAGDFSMGTFYNSIFASYAPDLSLLGAMGYDATTFGNHEFDYGVNALSDMITNSTDTPAILSGNIVFGDDADSLRLQSIWQERGGAAYKIIERGGYKIGLFGVMGQSSIDYLVSPGNISFTDAVNAAKETVKKLKDEGAQLIICLSHGGTDRDPKKSEDEILAQQVDGIDVIVSGHTHTELTEPIYRNHTWIVSAGSLSKYLGMMEIDADTKEKLHYELIPVVAESPVDEAIQTKIQEYKWIVNQNFLQPYGYTMDQVIAYSDFAVEDINHQYREFTDNATADLVADAYVYAGKLATRDTSFTIGLTAKGVVRGGLAKGDVRISDVYNIVNLGQGSDGVPGYPLIRLYLKGKDLMKVAELDRTIGKDIMAEAQLYYSGLQYQYSDFRFFLNHVISTETRTNAGFYIPIEPDKLYPVITNLYIANMLPLIGQKTHDQLVINSYDASGHLIDDFTSMIIYNSDGTELKEWQAVARYISDMDPVGGMPQMKADYRTARKEKIKDQNFSIIRFFKNTSEFGYKVYFIGVAAILSLLGLIRLITYLIRLHREKIIHRN